ncbi:MAG: DUF1232 domain-containing protein [Chloroflexota bacterium]
MIDRLRRSARALKSQLAALAVASRDPRTPWLARLLVVVAVAYALSPIDLIPDFIPVLGYLDDLLLLPLIIVLAIRLIPAEVMAEARERAEQLERQGTAGRWAALAIVVIWLILAAFVWRAVT